MPSIKDQSTVDLIARLFCSNGRVKSAALSEAGYADSYAIEGGRGCGVVFRNVHVIAAIKGIDGKQAKKQGMTVKRMHLQYDEDRHFAQQCNSPGAAVSASLNTARLYGMDKDNDQHAEEQASLDDSRIAEAKRIAGIRLIDMGGKAAG